MFKVWYLVFMMASGGSGTSPITSTQIGPFATAAECQDAYKIVFKASKEIKPLYQSGACVASTAKVK